MLVNAGFAKGMYLKLIYTQMQVGIPSHNESLRVNFFVDRFL
jgi:hypothetical protein